MKKHHTNLVYSASNKSSAGNPVIFLSPKKTVLDLNKSACELFKCGQKNVIGEDIEKLMSSVGITLPFNCPAKVIDGVVFSKIVTKQKDMEGVRKIVWDMRYVDSGYLFGCGFLLIGEVDKEKGKDLSGNKLLSTVIADKVISMDQFIKQNGHGKNILSYIVQLLPGYAHIKNARSFDYRISNMANANLLGCREIKTLIGKRVDEISHLTKTYIKQIQECDEYQQFPLDS